MSNTKREPLLSDDTLYKWSTENILSSVRVRDTYEAARAKDAELIQQLVDALRNLRDIHEFRVGREPLTGTDELKAAEDAGFKPSEQ
jgi:glutamine synthetase adenylyltransferase